MPELRNRIPVGFIIRRLLGFSVQYVSSGLLTLVLLMCFGALVFCQIALLGPDVRWLAFLYRMLPADLASHGTTVLHTADLRALLMRAYLLVSIVLAVLASAGRWLAARVRRTRPSNDAGAPAAATATHFRLHARRRVLVGLSLVSAVYACAFVAIRHAPMAAGSSRSDMYVVFGFLYVATVIVEAMYVIAGIAADLILQW